MTTLPDPKASRALLVGVSKYLHMAEDRQLPSVKNNLDRLATALSSEWGWSLPVGHCTVLHQPHDAETVIQGLRATADAATDTALFYFAGHGLIDPTIGTGLYLGLSGSYEPHGTHTALGYEYVRSEMRRCGALRKVIVLDCCWSGKAATGLMGGERLATAVEGTAVLTATAATRPALAPPEAHSRHSQAFSWRSLSKGSPTRPVYSPSNTFLPSFVSVCGHGIFPSRSSPGPPAGPRSCLLKMFWHRERSVRPIFRLCDVQDGTTRLNVGCC